MHPSPSLLWFCSSCPHLCLGADDPACSRWELQQAQIPCGRVVGGSEVAATAWLPTHLWHKPDRHWRPFPYFFNDPHIHLKELWHQQLPCLSEERHEDHGTQADHLPLTASSCSYSHRGKRSLCKAGVETWLKPDKMWPKTWEKPLDICTICHILFILKGRCFCLVFSWIKRQTSCQETKLFWWVWKLLLTIQTVWTLQRQRKDQSPFPEMIVVMPSSFPSFPPTSQISFAYPQTGLGAYFLKKKPVNLRSSQMIIGPGKVYWEGPRSSRQILPAAELWDQHNSHSGSAAHKITDRQGLSTSHHSSWVSNTNKCFTKSGSISRPWTQLPSRCSPFLKSVMASSAPYPGRWWLVGRRLGTGVLLHDRGVVGWGWRRERMD